MKVLIADFDFFAKVGGGQTFYRNLIHKNHQIEFYYFIQDEKSTCERPANAHGIPFKETYLIQDLAGYFDIDPPQWAKPLFVQASNIAALVQGMSFDIVTPLTIINGAYF